MEIKKQYIRDERSPKPKNEHVSKTMSANKAKNTGPEVTLRKALWNCGLKGYRTNYNNVPGKPDIAFTSKKLAIFVNGCFWHRCPYCNYSMPKTNTLFWQQKFAKNGERDAKKTNELQMLGWNVLTVWECQIKENVDIMVEMIQKMLK